MRHTTKTGIMFYVILGIMAVFLYKIDNQLELLKVIAFGVGYIILSRMIEAEMKQAKELDRFDREMEKYDNDKD